MASTAAQVQPGYLDANGNWFPYGPNTFVIGSTGQVNAGVAVTATASTALLMTGTGTSFILSNAGAKACFVEFGDNSVAATAVTLGAVGGSFPLLAGAIMSVSRAVGASLYISAICSAGESTTLYVSQGSGS